MEQNISEAYLSSKPSISKSPRVETACAKSFIFMGFQQNEVPFLDRGGRSKSTQRAVQRRQASWAWILY
eukprot:6101022-Amphidinium_carterae.2